MFEVELSTVMTEKGVGTGGLIINVPASDAVFVMIGIPETPSRSVSVAFAVW
jgi:hypothetical protein